MKKLLSSNIAITLALVILGLVMIIISNTQINYNGFDIDAAVSTIGSVLVIGSLASFFFENHAKSKLFEEIFEKTLKTTEVLRAGIQECHEHSKEIIYRDQISKARTILTLFTYSDGFLKINEKELERAAKIGTKIDFIFVRQESPVIETMIKLGWQKKSIDANYENIEKSREQLKAYKNVTFHFVDAIPRYAAVMFDEEIYVIEHTSSTGRSQVPAIKLSKHGYIGSFYNRDLQNLLGGSTVDK